MNQMALFQASQTQTEHNPNHSKIGNFESPNIILQVGSAMIELV
jgi:hypothetical protein